MCGVRLSGPVIDALLQRPSTDRAAGFTRPLKNADVALRRRCARHVPSPQPPRRSLQLPAPRKQHAPSQAQRAVASGNPGKAFMLTYVGASQVCVSYLGRSSQVQFHSWPLCQGHCAHRTLPYYAMYDKQPPENKDATNGTHADRNHTDGVLEAGGSQELHVYMWRILACLGLGDFHILSAEPLLGSQVPWPETGPAGWAEQKGPGSHGLLAVCSELQLGTPG